MLERIITALVLVAVVLSCMFATQSYYPMFMLMILAAGVAGYEWFKLMPRTTIVSKPKAWVYGACVAAVSTLEVSIGLNIILNPIVGTMFHCILLDLF